MKQVLVATMLAAVLSSLLTISVERALWGSPRIPAQGFAGSELKISLSEVERALEGIRKEIADSRGVSLSTPLPSVNLPAMAETDNGSRVAPAPAAASAPEPGGAEKPSTPTSPLGRFREVIHEDPDKGTVTNEAAKSKWILRGEDSVLAWFGKPARIQVADSGEEIWSYSLATGECYSDGEMMMESVIIRLNRGRVVDISR